MRSQIAHASSRSVEVSRSCAVAIVARSYDRSGGIATLLAFAAWMGLRVRLAEVGQTEVRVDLRRCERGVAEEFLDRTKITATFQHVRRVGMTQGVWAVLLESNGLEASVECASNARRVESFASGRQQERLRVGGSSEFGSTACEPGGDCVGGGITNGHEPCFAALAGHA